MEYILQVDEIKKIKDFLSKQNLADKNWKVNIICQKIREGLENLQEYEIKSSFSYYLYLKRKLHFLYSYNLYKEGPKRT